MAHQATISVFRLNAVHGAQILAVTEVKCKIYDNFEDTFHAAWARLKVQKAID